MRKDSDQLEICSLDERRNTANLIEVLVKGSSVMQWSLFFIRATKSTTACHSWKLMKTCHCNCISSLTASSVDGTAYPRKMLTSGENVPTR